MMENIFILPGNEQELFNRYLDNNEYYSERTAGTGQESLEQQAFPRMNAISTG
ncbi:hypothetical protein NXX23_17360 [Bacteroides ovatus]|nr:hypothetical protein [Bacteroides ovatus]